MADKEVEDINDLAAYSSDEEGEPEAEVETKPESEIKKCVPLPFLFLSLSETIFIFYHLIVEKLGTKQYLSIQGRYLRDNSQLWFQRVSVETRTSSCDRRLWVRTPF